MVNNSNLVTLLGDRASLQPNQIAYNFLGERKTPSCTLTYQQLEQQAKAIAAYLQSQIAPETRVLLIYPPGLEFVSAFLGCIYAGVIAIPAPSPEAFGKSRIILRLNAIVEDAQPSLVLTTSKIQSLLEKLYSEIPRLANCNSLVTDNLDKDWTEKWVKPEIIGDEM